MKPREISFPVNVSSAWPVTSRQTEKTLPEESASSVGDGISISTGIGKEKTTPSLADMQKAFLAQSISEGGKTDTESEVKLPRDERRNEPVIPAATAGITSKSAVSSVPVVMFQEDDTLSLSSLPVKAAPVDTAVPAEASQRSSSALFVEDQGSGFAMLLQPIADDKKQYGLSMQPSCKSGRMNSLRERVKAELQDDLPSEYEEFLAQTNGLDFDGLVFYGSEPGPIAGYDDRMLDGIIEANRNHRENGSMKKMLVLGESEDLLYVFDSKDHAFHAVDSCSLKKCEHYTSFKEMLAGALVSRV